MFFTFQSIEYRTYPHLLHAMFRMRKRVFADQLNWNVQVRGDEERDEYDDLGPVYLVWTDPVRQILVGSLRLMPTTGPTLLNSVFRKTYPVNCDFASPGMWEVTRLCLDPDALHAVYPDISSANGFSLMLLALFECAHAHGIETVISNFEPHMKRVYRRAGLAVEEIGRAGGFGRNQVCCGLSEVSEEVCNKMRQALGIQYPIFNHTLELSPDKSIRAA